MILVNLEKRCEGTWPLTGPTRKMMQEYKQQSEGQANSSPTDPQKTTSSMGMMQLPGRRGLASYPLDLVPGGVSDSTYEANLLGELAVISIGEHDVG